MQGLEDAFQTIQNAADSGDLTVHVLYDDYRLISNSTEIHGDVMCGPGQTKVKYYCGISFSSSTVRISLKDSSLLDMMKFSLQISSLFLKLNLTFILFIKYVREVIEPNQVTGRDRTSTFVLNGFTFEK